MLFFSLDLYRNAQMINLFFHSLKSKPQFQNRIVSREMSRKLAKNLRKIKTQFGSKDETSVMSLNRGLHKKFQKVV